MRRRARERERGRRGEKCTRRFPFQPASIRNPQSAIRNPRDGLTLYEVLIALAIFSGAMAVLGQALSTGSRAATQAKLRSEAMLRCEQKLGDVLAGVTPLQSESGAAFDDDAPNWTWDLQVEAGPTTGLMHIIVSATHAGVDSTSRASYSIARFVRDPQVFVIQAELDAEAKAQAQQTQSSQSSQGSQRSQGSR